MRVRSLLTDIDMENRKLFTALFIINFCITLGYGVVDSFFSLYVFELGARGALLGVPLAFYSVSKIFFSVPAGSSISRAGADKVLAVSVICFCCVSVGYLFAGSVAFVVVLRVLQGAACAAFRASVLAVLGYNSHKSAFASVSGTFDMSFYGALGAGPVVGGFIRKFAGFNGVFMLLFILCLVSLIILLLTTYDIKGREESSAVAVKSFKPGIQYYGLVSFIFFRGFGISACAAFLPLYIEQGMALDSLRSGVVLCISTVFMTFSLRPLSMLGKMFEQKNIIASGGAAVSIMYLLIPGVSGFQGIMVICAGMGIFGALSQPACTAALLEEGEKYGTGKAVGVFNMFMNMGFAAGSLIGSFVYGMFGIEYVFITSGMAGIAGCSVFLILSESNAKKELTEICERGYASKTEA